MAETPQKIQRGRGRPFQKGQSGNPAGKPKGRLCSVTLAIQALLDGESEALTRKAVEMALAGDTTALRLCLERLCPPRKDSPVVLAGLPRIESAQDIPRAMGAILEAVGKGRITPGEGQALSGLLEGHRKALEFAELEARIAALENIKPGDK